MKSNIYDITMMGKQYFPDSSHKNARRRFISLLQSERDLWKRLCALHFKSYQRSFTPRQYEMVIDVLGKPEYMDSRFDEWM